MSKKKQFVNGPMNTVRLEGNIGSVKKTIYLFMDFHIPVEWQTECDDIRSKDFDKFLVDTFDKTEEMKHNIIYDLFVESNPLFPILFPGESSTRGRYLFGQTENLLSKSINIETGKVLQSKEFNNVRFHYTDIRDYTTDKFRNVMYEIERITNFISHINSLIYKDIQLIIDGLKIIQSQIITLYQLIYESKNLTKSQTKIIYTKDQEILAKYSEEDFDKIKENLIYKILKSYTHADVHQIINKIISNELHETFQNCIKELNQMISEVSNILKLLEPYKEKQINDTLIKQKDGTYFYGIYDKDMHDYISTLKYIPINLHKLIPAGVGLYLMDIYLLRRILDKDYVSNAIVYTGAHHSLNYIRILVKHFDFKITNYSYLKNNDLTKAEKIIIKSKNMDEISELFYPPELKQCSDLSSFPQLLI